MAASIAAMISASVVALVASGFAAGSVCGAAGALRAVVTAFSAAMAVEARRITQIAAETAREETSDCVAKTKSIP
jgi:hypothetical protein